MIQVINRALNILELIAKDPQKEFGLSEIADSLQLNHSTCANILKTLVNREYVEQSIAKKGYKLGYMAYRLTNTNLYDKELINASEKLLKKLNEEINETVILSIIKNDKRVLLKEFVCTHDVQIRTKEETKVYKTTTGRMILSYYSSRKLREFLLRVGLPSKEDWPEIKTKSDLINTLNKIKTDQFLITHNKNHVVGLAAPIFKNNKAIASIGIYLPDLRFGDIEKNKIINSLKVTANQINLELKKMETSSN